MMSGDQELFSASNVSLRDAQLIWRYIRGGGADNSTQLLKFIASEYFSVPAQWQEPKSLPLCSIYNLGVGVTSLPEIQAFWLKQNRYPPKK